MTVQICWSDELQCPPTSTEVHSRLNWWLDGWLDPDSFQSQVTIQFRETDGEVFVYDAGRGHDVRDELVIAGPLAIPAILDAE
jgi:hypothetical protein